MISFILFLLLGVVTTNSSVIFEDCGSAYEITSVSIGGCGMRLPCYITLGENVPVSVRFHADFVSRNLIQDVVININNVNLRTQVTPEPCAALACPVNTNAVSSFTSVLTVPTSMALVIYTVC